jgi:hypothetical protein
LGAVLNVWLLPVVALYFCVLMILCMAQHLSLLAGAAVREKAA